MDDLRFRDKRSAREHVWSRLEEAGVAAFPFPPQGRIPNFRGAAAAADRLVEDAIFQDVGRVKANPDAPQRPLRERMLRRGIELIVPTPRLRGGFRRLDPERIPEDSIRAAVSLSGMKKWGEPVPVRQVPRVDLVVTGCVAVTRDGRRCGKGEGYSDLELAILRELGHPEVPVVSTVHPLQIVEAFPSDAHDLGLWRFATPDDVIEVEPPRPGPRGIDWSLLGPSDLEAMPVLAELRDAR